MIKFSQVHNAMHSNPKITILGKSVSSNIESFLIFSHNNWLNLNSIKFTLAAKEEKKGSTCSKLLNAKFELYFTKNLLRVSKQLNFYRFLDKCCLKRHYLYFHLLSARLFIRIIEKTVLS